MSRYRALFDKKGLLAEFEDDVCTFLRADAPEAPASGPQIMRDIAPYKSMIDGSMIDGRKRHRDHLKAHNCVEIGSDTSHMKRKPVPLPSRKPLLHQILADVSERELQAMIKREIRNNRL